MATFSIRLAKRTVTGQAIPGKYVEFETDSASELAHFYYKQAIANSPKCHKKSIQKKQKNQRRQNDGDAQIPEGVGAE